MRLTISPAVRKRLKKTRVARLATTNLKGQPHVVPICYVFDGALFYTAIDRKPKRTAEPARVRYLRRRPEAALTVDRYDDDWSKLAWVQVLGHVELLDPAKDEAGMEALAAKYAPYRDDPPPGPLLRLVPERALHWRAEKI